MADHRSNATGKAPFSVLFKKQTEVDSAFLWVLGKRRSLREGETSPSLSLLLIDIAFVVGVGVAAASVLHVDHALIKVGQRHSVLLIDVALHVSLQQGALVVRKSHGEKRFRVTNKLVDVSFSSHLRTTEGEKRYSNKASCFATPSSTVL